MAIDHTNSLPRSITGLNPYPWLNWWYRLVAPPVPPRAEELPLREREFLRRGKLISIALFIYFIELALQYEAAVQHENSTASDLTVHMALFTVASALNHFRKLLLAGIIPLSCTSWG